MRAALTVSQDCSLLASVSAQDRTLKVFDVATFDMIAMLRLPFQPACAEWAYQACRSLCLVWAAAWLLVRSLLSTGT